MENYNSGSADTARREMSSDEFASLGMGALAFVKSQRDETGKAFFAIYAANGMQIGAAPDRDIAFQATREHELQPLSVH